jgi:hypothetical protein
MLDGDGVVCLCGWVTGLALRGRSSGVVGAVARDGVRWGRTCTCAVRVGRRRTGN